MFLLGKIISATSFPLFLTIRLLLSPSVACQLWAEEVVLGVERERRWLSFVSFAWGAGWLTFGKGGGGLYFARIVFARCFFNMCGGSRMGGRMEVLFSFGWLRRRFTGRICRAFDHGYGVGQECEKAERENWSGETVIRRAGGAWGCIQQSRRCNGMLW